MNEQEKIRPAIHPAVPGDSGDAGSAGLAEAQQKMNELLTAADAAINSALSHDSAAFLAANQQRGGQ